MSRPWPLTLRATLATLAAGLVALAAAAPADAKRTIQVGFGDDVFSDALFFDPDASVREFWFDRTAKTNAELVRVNVYWNRVASGTGSEPVNPTDPDDPAYNWTDIDRIAREATERGLEPLFTVLLAPEWAEGGNRPSFEKARSGTWKPHAGKFEDFAEALATRYSGSYPDPANPGQNLPAVEYFEGWNEPNLQLYINPQREGKKNTSPAIYRDLLNGFYDGIKAGSPGATVLGAGTGPFGDESGPRRIPPKEFWRDVFCLKEKGKKLKFDKKGCPSGEKLAHLDIFAHNGINEPGSPPRKKAVLDDNATAADMGELVDIIKAAEKYGTVLPDGMKRETWSTEMWFESNPPEKRNGSPLARHAQYTSQVLYMLWKQRVSAGIFLQIRDSPYDPSSPSVIGLQSGVYFHNEKAKPALQSVRFPFYAKSKGKKKAYVWGKAPRSGEVEIRSGKKSLASFDVDAGSVFSKTIQLKGGGKHKLEAAVAGQESIKWKLK